MSEETLSQIADRAYEAAAAVAWKQWATLGSMAASETPARSMIDPEALVLITLSLSSHERRLWDVLTEWSAGGVKLLSVQRMKNLAGRYPESIRGMLAEYAFFVYKGIGDQRWKSLHDANVTHEHVTRGKRWEAEINLRNEAALMLRLRRGIGVNMRADVLSYLLATRGVAATVRQLAEALQYTNAATRRAAEDLASAQLVQVSDGVYADTYAVDPKAWSRLLGFSGMPPPWRRWQDFFEYIAHIGEWEQSARERKISKYALEVLGGELTRKHERAFDYEAGRTGRSRLAVRERAEDSFGARTLALCDWMVNHV